MDNRRDQENVEGMIRLVEIALVIGRNLVFIIAAFVGVTFALAVYFSVTGNIVGSIISLASCVASIVFLAQVRQTRRRHRARQAGRR